MFFFVFRGFFLPFTFLIAQNSGTIPSIIFSKGDGLVTDKELLLPVAMRKKTIDTYIHVHNIPTHILPVNLACLPPFPLVFFLTVIAAPSCSF